MVVIVYRSPEGSSSQEQLSPVDGIVNECATSIDATGFSTTITAPSTSQQNQNRNEDVACDTATTSTIDSCSSTDITGTTSGCGEMKRVHAKQLIEKYFYQLTDGCGNPNCTNRNCASSGIMDSLTPNQAAAKAIQLFSEEAPLCDTPTTKLPRTLTNNDDSDSVDGENGTNR